MEITCSKPLRFLVWIKNCFYGQTHIFTLITNKITTIGDFLHDVFAKNETWFCRKYDGQWHKAVRCRVEQLIKLLSFKGKMEGASGRMSKK